MELSDTTMAPCPLPEPLREWSERENRAGYEWRKPGVVAYDADADVWRVDETALRFVAESEEERFYCGLYEGPLEPQPVMFWAVLSKAMASR